MLKKFLLEQLPVIYWLANPDLTINYASGLGLSVLGLAGEELLGLHVQDFLDSPEEDGLPLRMIRGALRGEHGRFPCAIRGRQFEVVVEPARDAADQIHGVLGLAQDVSDRGRLVEQQLRLQQEINQVQKLENLGLLAAGVAHDFNNILVGIMGGAELMLRDLPEDSNLRPLAEMIHLSGERAAGLTRQMLVYTGRAREVPQVINLNRLIKDCIPLFVAALPRKSIAIKTILKDGLPDLRVNPAEMQQILLNLILNAAEATTQPAGSVTLMTSTRTLTETQLGWPYKGTLSSGEYVILEVSDRGTGIPDEALASIFEPFFSTKPSRRGLGLAVVRQLVQDMKGGIEIDTHLGSGSTFRILLPFTGPPIQPATAASAQRA